MSANMQSQVNSQSNDSERRTFPRILARCPVRYSGQSFDELGIAELRDYSAGGFRMISDTILLNHSKIRIELMPETKSRVPKIIADAVVLRCGMRDDHRYEIACKLTKVNR
jgi:hypothetical protein